ncbi:unnamed protein product [Lactuca virosa]|uniref:Uncharacterized protein n=1 Tax=Lactuca virosa TaxID=75947 RepID=A0AAU9LQP9_9ASTR|nr:unnamed protein product [Lactuca virosa]
MWGIAAGNPTQSIKAYKTHLLCLCLRLIGCFCERITFLQLQEFTIKTRRRRRYRKGLWGFFQTKSKGMRSKQATTSTLTEPSLLTLTMASMLEVTKWSILPGILRKALLLLMTL